jgi:uncharacterized protein (TIGR03437 family)
MFFNKIGVFTLAAVCSTAGLAQITLNQQPTRQIGQTQLPQPNPFNVTTVNPNLVEGREFFNPTGIALDTSVTPPRVYVADTRNNRVLAWKDAVNFTNGKPADLVLGQRDMISTFANGPGRNTTNPLSTGFAVPSGVAVYQGDLYVADAGNDRVLRFRKPFSATDQVPDLCIGQPSFNTTTINYPGGQLNSPTDKGLALNNGNSAFTVAITFDSQGNLWLTDAGNNRVLRYAAADISPSNKFAPTANLEIGQLDFFSKQPSLPLNGVGRLILNQLATPAAIAFDALGRVYIADADANTPAQLSRVLVFSPPFTTGMQASRVMGIPPTQPTGGPALTDAQIYSVAMNSPSAIFFLPGTQGIGVLDSGYHRVLIFDPYDQWPDVATATSPSAKFVVGHSSGISGIRSTDAKSLNSNDGNPLPSTSTFSSPQAAVFVNNELYVADSGNNRMVVMPLQNGTFGPATRVLGQDRFNTNSINLIEGREFFFSGGLGTDSAVALDSTGDVPHLYVSDPYNNRVLGFRDVRSLKSGSAADIVIGQPDKATAVCNYPSGDINVPTQSSLCRPVGLLVDASGNLYVADSLNGRVLRFPTPFSHQGNQVADLVLGKSNFTSPPLTDATARNMYVPYGLAFAGGNGLLVSDQNLNRVLFIPFTNGGFTSADNGKAATKVFGQTDFTSSVKGSNDTGLNSPHHIAADTDGRPYVVDSGNSRVLIFDQVLNNPDKGAHAAYPLNGVGGAEGIFVNPNTGELWVSDPGGNAIRKFLRYDQLVFNPAPTVSIPADGPIAVAQDQYGDLIVADGTNRVTFYYPALTSVNGASFQAGRALAPNAIASIFPAGTTFGKDTATAFDLPKPLPLPTVLADIQVTVNGVPAPLYAVTPGQINYIVPWGTDTGNPADVQVLRVSTGQLLAASLVAMNNVSPAIFVSRPLSQGVSLAAVINGDGVTVNDPTHPAKRGDIISIFGTGQGMVSSPPADGDIPKNGVVSANASLRVVIGTDYTDQIAKLPGEENRKPFEFSGLSPNYPGMWQVNVQIPMATAPGQTPIALQLNSVGSNDPTVVGYRLVIYVQ